MLALPDLVDTGPEHAASSRDLLRILQAAIDRLPEEFRQVFMLRGVEQLSIAETAELLDIKPATVKTRFHRARRMLQELLHRKLDDVVRDTFPLGGQRCDAIVGDRARADQAPVIVTRGGTSHDHHASHVWWILAHLALALAFGAARADDLPSTADVAVWAERRAADCARPQYVSLRHLRR